jgi:hypothetical protein
VTGTGGGSGTGGSGTGGSGTGGSGTGGSGTGGSTVSGLVAYYKCDETSGTTLTDSSGNGNHGKLNGTYSFGAGKVGNALTLAKSGSGYVDVPTKVFSSLGDLTIAVWAYVNTADTWPRIIDTGIFQGGNPAPETGTKYMNLTPRDKNGNLRWSITTNGWGSEESLNTAALSAGAWKHVTIVLVESTALGWLYIDGAVVVSNESTSQQPNDLGAIDYAYLGKSQSPADPYFDGKLDELRVYNRALSAAEVQALYNFTGP